MDFCFVNNGMNIHHHNGDYAARTISPGTAFMFTRLRIGVSSGREPALLVNGGLTKSGDGNSKGGKDKDYLQALGERFFHHNKAG